MTPSEIAKEAERALRFHDNPKEHEKYCKQGNINVIEAAIEKARAMKDEDYEETIAQFVSEMHKVVSEDTELRHQLEQAGEDTKRLDWLEKQCFTNREGYRQLRYEFKGTFREAADTAMKGEG